jgi:hypothetical protein
MSSESEKAHLGSQTISIFCKQFGEDVYGKILLEVLLEGLINEETIFVFGEQEQEGNQADNSSAGNVTSHGQGDEFIEPHVASDLGETDSTDCP